MERTRRHKLGKKKKKKARKTCRTDIPHKFLIIPRSPYLARLYNLHEHGRESCFWEFFYILSLLSLLSSAFLVFLFIYFPLRLLVSLPTPRVDTSNLLGFNIGSVS